MKLHQRVRTFKSGSENENDVSNVDMWLRISSGCRGGTQANTATMARAKRDFWADVRCIRPNGGFSAALLVGYDCRHPDRVSFSVILA